MLKITYILTDADILNGTFSILVVVFSIIIGIYIASRYFKYGDENFLFIGAAWIGLNQGWWPSSVSFIKTLLTMEPLADSLYFLIGNIGVPIFTLGWMYALTKLMYPKYKTYILIAFSVFMVFFEIYLFTLLFLDPSFIGIVNGAVDVEYDSIFRLILLSDVALVFITGLHFAVKSIRSKNQATTLKGKFLFIAFISYFFGAIADTLPLSPLFLPIIRIILILSGIAFYFGWVLPEPVKNIFIRKK
ncbi:MAG: hypothetical protein EU541_04545 [Promethearchaeota archaeon]|nr:MAG: hypothetical protein EU541_04545 [Candidatus Lokiarchaeota archaeon]